MRTIIGIDNGSTGTIGIITPSGAHFFETPTQEYLHYGKKGTVSNRLDRKATAEKINASLSASGVTVDQVRVFIERPFTAGPMMIKSMLSAHRMFEATICLLEDLNLGYDVIDSGEWQKPVLGGIKGSPELKKASLLRGSQLYPQFAAEIKRHGDADGLLIAHHFAYRSV